MFGDNLSMISDTTIAAVKTQGCEMKDKFKMNFLIVLPAAIITVVFFWFVTRNVAYDITENLDYNFWQVVPYLVVLIGALIGINVFLVLIGGTVISLIAGVATGNIVLADMFTVVGDGVVSMYDITVISILVACIVSLVKMNGRKRKYQSSGRGAIPHRWYSPRAARHDSVRFRSRQYSLDERRLLGVITL